MLEDFRYRPPPSNLATMKAAAAADWAASTAVASAAPPPPTPAPVPEAEPKQLSNAERRALGLPPAKPTPPGLKRPKAPETEEEIAAERKTIQANSRKRVERMRSQKYERSLEKAADILLHDTAWLPCTAKKERLEEVKGLRKRWVELLRPFQQEMLETITAELIAVEEQVGVRVRVGVGVRVRVRVKG